MSSPLYVRQLQLGPMENFVYLVGPGQGEEAVVVDPAWDVLAIEAALAEDGRRLTGAFVTHSHGDHINGLPELLSRHDVPVYCQQEELDFSTALQAHRGAMRPLKHGDRFRVGELELSALHTPGHTPGSQCLHVADALISGDTLFVNGCGRCDLNGGDPERMYESIQNVLLKLPDSTTLLPGHDYAHVPRAPLAEVKPQNPYLNFTDLGDFVKFRMRPRT